MPRCARIKGCDSTYHIMVRSINDVALYRDYKDKDKYLSLIKKYQEIFLFKVYAYCIMDTHAHFIIFAYGADISKIMHGINQSYAQYFNKKYKRHGHVFADRFKSNIVKDERYLLSLSGYIHNNPKDIKRFENRIEKYPYSSLGVYLGLYKDMCGILDINFVLDHFGSNIISARKNYVEFISKCKDLHEIASVEFKDEKTEYRSGKTILIRGYSIDDIVSYVAEKTGSRALSLNIKHYSKATELRAICALFMRSLCDMKCTDICKVLGNITQSRVSKLCSVGYDLMCSNEKYKSLMQEFIQRYRVA